MSELALQFAKKYESLNPAVDGDFLSHDGTVLQTSIDKKPLNTEKIDGLGYIQKNHVNVNGLDYLVWTTQPKEPVTDIPIITSNFWLGRPDRGYNKRTMRRFMREGVPMNFSSIEQNTWHIPDLGQSALNLAAINYALADKYHFDKKRLIASGLSQGAMKGIALTAQAPDIMLPDGQPIDVIHADLVGPCCANPTSLRTLTPNRVADIAKNEYQSIEELLEIPAHVLRRYPGSVDFSPKNILQCIKGARTLLSGDTGQYATKIPREQSGHITSLTGDTFLGQGEAFADILADHPNFITEMVSSGGHLGILTDEIAHNHKHRVVNAIQNHSVASDLKAV